MNKRLFLLFLFGLLFLESCIMEPPKNSRKNALNTNLTGTNVKTGTVSPKTFAADEIEPYWFDTQKIVGTMTINMNTQNIYYLRGQKIHDWLSNKNNLGVYYYQQSYCLRGLFNNATLYKDLWVRAIPLAISNVSSLSVERLLRIDIPNANDNSAACNPGGDVAFSPTQICKTTNCVGKITTTAPTPASPDTPALSLTVAGQGLQGLIPSTTIDLASVKLQIDLQSNATSTISQCTNSSCTAKGFDCCIEGQCVKDATEKPSAKNNMTEYNQAKQEYAANPLSFINWPNVFYICSNIAHTPPSSSTTTTTPVSDAQARVSAYLNDYQCVSDVESSLGYARCKPGLNLTSYNSIKLKLARSCGCDAIDSEVAVKCPDWGVRPLYGSSLQTEANIVDFYCYTPTPESQMGPITNLNVTVPNRTAPHRLYGADGKAYDQISTMTKAVPATTQEGTEFSYVDDYNKMSPYNSSYNINSVLGSMSVDLRHALPAKSVTVEIGKSYILSATSGYYTPCAKCARDNWFQNFFPFAPSQKGTGLKASGFTTSRDSYSDNITLGNYEDTKFGRACFVPATMLPFAHKKEASLQTQRKNRLTTQAAYYINGYQRDWFGFNQGAVIGSFDGITWFAIGNGRRITATTSKLYLAINAAFVDLADNSDTIVNIIPDSSLSLVADYDFDTSLADNDAKQNQGATCQRFHQCTTDTDCITQLGWEYVCADVSQYKTKWPAVDGDGNELLNQERKSTLFEILNATADLSKTTRCVYRGAGAPCKGNTASLNSINAKLFTCAPNFFCAPVSGNAFNSELVRSPNEPNSMLYGFDANVLGRPLNYVSGNKTLPTEAITNIKANAADVITDTTDFGLCRPGKSLNASFTMSQRHSQADASKRTDYISQIANCDSSILDKPRFINCPAIDTDPNSTNYLNLIASPTTTVQAQQNSCGVEAKYTVSGSPVSTFKTIEGLTLPNNTNISSPLIAKDACLRRAGSVCHSDLDCSPNSMHEQASATMPLAAFGNTEAEQLYWKESLICSQGAAKPALNTADYNTYQLGKNRCCREVGKDFTMFTQGAETGSNASLKTAEFSYKSPSLAGRYSRYSVSPTAHTTTSAIPIITPTTSLSEPNKHQWKVLSETGSNTCCGGGFIRKFADGTNNWMTKGRLYLDTANFSCLNYRSPLADPLLSTFSDTRIRRTSYDEEFGLFCSKPNADPEKSGCLQIPYRSNLTDPTSTAYSIIAPVQYTEDGVLDTSPLETPPESGSYQTDNNVNAPYQPVPLGKSPTLPANDGHSYFHHSIWSYGASFYLPAYIGMDNHILTVKIKYYDKDGKLTGTSANLTKAPACQTVISGGQIDRNATYDATVAPQIATCLANQNACVAACDIWDVQCLAACACSTLDLEGYCIDTTTEPTRPIMHVKAKHDIPGTGDNSLKWKWGGVEISFTPIEKKDNITVVTPGNANYYETKLARLELLGIPQMTYEPIYCSNDQRNVVPGIFKSTLKTRANFDSRARKYSYSTNAMQMYSTDTIPTAAPDTTAGIGNAEQYFTYQSDVDHGAIFSSKDFMCCTPLGMTPKNGQGSGCCSGYAVTTNGKQICKLPIETDLNVYFNRFVSNEGVGDSLPGANGAVGLIDSTGEDSDFNPYTGEPKLRSSTSDKIYALGIAYCSTGRVTRGGAFERFLPQPSSGTVPAGYTAASYPISIVDSFYDNLGSGSDTKYYGKPGFDRGVRWNHHYYCRD